MDIRKLNKEELEKIIIENKLFSQKDLALFFEENISIVTNYLVKHKIRLLEIKREEILKFIKENPFMSLKEISDYFNVSEVTISRLKKKAGLARKNYVNYKKIHKKNLEKIYNKHKTLKAIVNQYGGDAKKWKEILIKHGLYKEKIKYKRRGIKEKFLKLYEKEGDKLFFLKDKKIAKLLNCSISYVSELRIKYIKKIKQKNKKGECVKKFRKLVEEKGINALKMKNEEIVKLIDCSIYAVRRIKTILRKEYKQKGII